MFKCLKLNKRRQLNLIVIVKHPTSNAVLNQASQHIRNNQTWDINEALAIARAPS